MGALDGVLSTRTAWIGEREVVEVRFRAAELGFEALLAHAIAHSCDQRVFATSDAQLELARKKLGARAERFQGELRRAKDDDQLYYLGRSPLRFLPLTSLQAQLVNAALAPARVSRAAKHRDPRSSLSPRQQELLRRIEQALSRDAKVLDGLERPSAMEKLDEYEVALMRRLQG
ncbi:MAG: hypothetical protein IPN34_07575 [Planctomycetes bacterium]|nr:hypothetical protein [Planctomycetota bacterium]